MNSGTRDTEPSSVTLQSAIETLAKALKIVVKDSKKYYRKNASDVSESTLLEIDKSFIPLSNLLLDFGKSWIDSHSSGPDAVEKSLQLSERIDVKLLQTGKLDFEQFEKIIVRLNRADDALLGLKRISFYISYYRNLCAEKKLVQPKEHAELFIDTVLNEVKDIIERNSERLNNQIARCNLYYQNRIEHKMFQLALVSLGISTAALVYTVIGLLL